MRGRPKAGLVLSQSEREQLQSWSQRRKTAQALALGVSEILCARLGDLSTAAGVALRRTTDAVVKSVVHVTERAG